MYRFIVLAALGGLFQTAWADEGKTLSAEVLWQLERVGSPVVSPDGDTVVVPVTRYATDNDDSDTQLWLLATSGKDAQRALTMAGAKASEPVFSPDGKQLAFVSKRDDDEAGQIYILPMAGPGEAVRITEVPTGVHGLRWVGSHVYFMSSVWPGLDWEAMQARLTEEREDNVSAMVWDEMPYSYFDHYLDENRETHLFRVAADGGEVEAMTAATGLQFSRDDSDASHYDVTTDERLIAMVADSDVGSVYPNLDVYTFTPGAAATKNLTPDNPASDVAPQFSPNDKTLAFLRQRIAGFYADQHKLMLHDVADGDTRMLHADWDRSAAGVTWASDGRGFYGAIDDAAMYRIYYLPAGKGTPRPITGDTNFGGVAIADDGTLIATNQSGVYPSRVVRINTRNGAVTRLDNFNDEALADVAVGTYESVTYKGSDDKDIQMWVHYPPGFDDSKEYPLILLIHGGPHGAVSDFFHYRWNAQTFASWGYVTAWPNFHGSSSFGQAFTDSINPDWITKPYADVIAAAEYLTAKPYIDAERTVAAGGSYGGYLSTILLGREHPFNALVIHAAVYDLYAQMSADFAVNMQRFGPYWEKPEIYREQSPHYYAANFNTPSLIIHGQNDLRVPVGQGFELYRTLQTRGVDSRLVYYPDENHWVLKRANSLHWYGEFRNWVEKYASPGPQSR